MKNAFLEKAISLVGLAVLAGVLFLSGSVVGGALIPPSSEISPTFTGVTVSGSVGIGLGTATPDSALNMKGDFHLINGKAKIEGNLLSSGLVTAGSLSEAVPAGTKLSVTGDAGINGKLTVIKGASGNVLTIDNGHLMGFSGSFSDYLKIGGALRDKDNFPGDSGQVLSSVGTGVQWIKPVASATGWTVSGTNIYSSGIGNVGIGTTAPTDKLNISTTGGWGNKGGTSALRLDSTSTGNVSTVLELASTAPGAFDIGLYGSGASPAGMVYFNQRNNAPMRFLTNNTERVTIDGTGNVGIGTSSPAVSLQVGASGTGANSNAYVYGSIKAKKIGVLNLETELSTVVPSPFTGIATLAVSCDDPNAIILGCTGVKVSSTPAGATFTLASYDSQTAANQCIMRITSNATTMVVSTTKKCFAGGL